MSKEKIKYAITGCGYFAKDIIRILKHNNIDVVAVTSPDNGLDFANGMGIKYFKSKEEMFDVADFDALIVSSPNYVHYEDVIFGAKHKKHIFCEKPIALSYSHTKDMIDECKKNNVSFMAGHILYFMNGVRKAKEFIKEGKIGDLIFCHAERTGFEEKKEKVSWKKMQKYSGGHLFHHIHEIDLIQSILGDAKSVYTIGGNICHNGEGYGDEDDTLFLSLKFDNNRFATMQYGSSFHFAKHFVIINGTEGAIELNFTDAKGILKTKEKIEYFNLGDNEEEDKERREIYNNINGGIMYGNPNTLPPKWLTTILSRELLYFDNFLKTGVIDEEYKKLFNGTAAMSSVKTAESALQSLRENKVIEI